MKKLCSLGLLLMSMTAAVASPGKMKLHGEYPLGEGKKLYLTSGYDKLDSAIVKSGKFDFALNAKVVPGEYLITRSNKEGKSEAILIYLDNYDTYVKMDSGTYVLFNTKFIKHTVTGNPTHQAVSEVNEIMLRKPMDEVMQKPELKNKLIEVANRGDMATAMVMWKYGSVYTHIMKLEELKSCIQKVDPAVAETKLGQEFLNTYKKLLSLKAGSIAPDFTMNTPEGKPLSLLEFVKGKKLVLVDFWASWCGPCRKKNPEVVDLYNQFHERGLDVLGVSLDENLDKWKEAIVEDKLPWAQISDLKGWKSEICKTYNFNGIPFLVLLDGEGRILAEGNDLRTQLKMNVEKYCK